MILEPEILIYLGELSNTLKKSQVDFIIDCKDK